jgi:hypothetical protein
VDGISKAISSNWCRGKNLNTFLFSSKIILVGIQDEGKNKMTGAAYNALRRIGARNPLNADFRGSFALVGYTGPGRPPFVKQVKYH